MIVKMIVIVTGNRSDCTVCIYIYLFIFIVIELHSLRFPHNTKDIRLELFCTIRANTQVELGSVCVAFKGLNMYGDSDNCDSDDCDGENFN